MKTFKNALLYILLCYSIKIDGLNHPESDEGSVNPISQDEGTSSQENPTRSNPADNRSFTFEYTTENGPEFKTGGSSLWKHSVSGCEVDYSDFLEVKVAVFISYKNCYIHFMGKCIGEWEVESFEKVTLPRIKIITVDDKGYISENNSNTYERVKFPDSINYKFNLGARCQEVKIEDLTVWKHGDEGINKDPDSITHNFKTDSLIISFSDQFISCIFKNGSWTKKVHSHSRDDQVLPLTPRSTDSDISLTPTSSSNCFS